MPKPIDEQTRTAAERFIARYGCEAPVEARRRARELDHAGRGAEAAEWERIAQLASAMLSNSSADGATLH